MKSSSRRPHIPFSIRFEIWGQPCVVCGTPYRIKCDHIIPYSRGGDSTRKNLQPLCHDCNHFKFNNKTNDEISQWVLSKGVGHFLNSVFKEDTKYCNPYDGPELWQWKKAKPERVAHAHELYATFLRKQK